MPNKIAIILVIAFLVSNLALSINQTASNETFKNETTGKNQTIFNITSFNQTSGNESLTLNATHVNETFVNQTLVNETLVNVTLVNQTILNVTQVNETLGNESLINITLNVTLENVTLINQTISNVTQVNETFVNETLVNETLTNVTLVNQTILNVTQVNETFVNQTISNETLMNVTLNVTLENVTLVNQTIYNVTQVNETFVNQTISNETLANVTFNQTMNETQSLINITLNVTLENVTLVNQTISNVTQVNETFVNETLVNETLANVTLNKTVIGSVQKNLTYGEKRLYLGSSLKNNTVMVFEGIYLEEKDTVFYVDITIFDNSSAIYSKDKKTDYNGYFDFIFVPKPDDNYQMSLTILSPSGNKSMYNYTFSIENPIPTLYPSLTVEKPSSIYLGIPFNITVYREGGACMNYSLSVTPSINDTLIGEIYRNNSMKQTFLIENASKVPEISIEYQDTICKINDNIIVDLKPHIVVERIVDSNAVINDTLTVRINLMANVPIYNVTVKEMFNSSLVSHVDPLLNDNDKNLNVALTNNSIEWYYSMIDGNVTLKYTLIPLQAGELRLGSCNVSYEVLG